MDRPPSTRIIVKVNRAELIAKLKSLIGDSDAYYDKLYDEAMKAYKTQMEEYLAQCKEAAKLQVPQLTKALEAAKKGRAVSVRYGYSKPRNTKVTYYMDLLGHPPQPIQPQRHHYGPDHLAPANEEVRIRKRIERLERGKSTYAKLDLQELNGWFAE